MQSINSSEMCSLYLTHPSAHTHTHTHTHTEQWAVRGAVGGSVPCRDSNPQPRVASPFLHLKTLDIILLIVNISVAYDAFYK